jgi:hypothetical protein
MAPGKWVNQFKQPSSRYFLGYLAFFACSSSSRLWKYSASACLLPLSMSARRVFIARLGRPFPFSACRCNRRRSMTCSLSFFLKILVGSEGRRWMFRRSSPTRARCWSRERLRSKYTESSSPWSSAAGLEGRAGRSLPLLSSMRLRTPRDRGSLELSSNRARRARTRSFVSSYQHWDDVEEAVKDLGLGGLDLSGCG